MPAVVGAVVGPEVGPDVLADAGAVVGPMVAAELGSVGSVGCGPVESPHAARATTSDIAITVRPQMGRIATLYATDHRHGWPDGCFGPAFGRNFTPGSS